VKFTVVTILPELIEPALVAGVVGRAREAGTITVDTVNPRDFTTDRHRTVDDSPYGGGPGMVMKAEPLLAAIERASEPPPPAQVVLPPAPDKLELTGDVEDITSTLRFNRAEPRDSTHDIASTRRFQRAASTIEHALENVDASIERVEAAIGGDLEALAPGEPAAAGATTAKGRAHRILLSPSGKPLTQGRVRELAALEHLVLVCGRYEGVDQRAIDLAIDEELSIGDYVLSGGELGALVIIDAVARYVPGVLGEATSVDDESFSAGLLEYPQYTKPAEVRGLAVPAVLMSGNHAAIASWRRQQSMQRTAARRPDLWRSFQPTKADNKLLPPLRARTHIALVHHPVVDRVGTVITTALTNFDIHDIARSSMTFGLAGYHIVTPITSQREKAQHIAGLWMGDEQGEHRAAALRLVRTADSIETVIANLTAEHGGTAPRVVATSARSTSFPAAPRRTSSELLAEATLDPAPLLILLGSGWGLADHLIPSVSRVLAPIEGGSDWNHLSVRSAGAVILDRLFGRPA